MTTATGFGPLPDLVLDTAGPRALRRVFQRADVPERIADERSMRLPLAGMVRLFEEGGRAAGDRLLGLRVGRLMNPGDYGMWLDYSMAAPTLRLAIRRLSWSMPLHQQGPGVTLLDTPELCAFAYWMPDLPGADPALHADHIIPSMWAVVRDYLGQDWRPDWIGLPYPRDPDARKLIAALETPLRFGCDAILLPLGPGEADRRDRAAARSHDAPTQSDVLARFRRRGGGHAVVAEDFIRFALLSGRVGVDGVARRMDLSVRSLQRTLAQDGTTFEALVEKVRREKAREMLANPDMPISQVAAALGYGDPSNFGRACRRWTGQAPSALRAALAPEATNTRRRAG